MKKRTRPFSMQIISSKDKREVFKFQRALEGGRAILIYNKSHSIDLELEFDDTPDDLVVYEQILDTLFPKLEPKRYYWCTIEDGSIVPDLTRTKVTRDW